MLPQKESRISQEYGRPGKYKKGYHTGIDTVADGVDKGVYNHKPGNVIRARFAPGKGADPNGWGNYVIVRQDDGHDVLYAHLAQIAVTNDERVDSGDKLGVQGSTGNSTGAHLHFEVWLGAWTNRNDINPADYLGVKNVVGTVEYVSELQKSVTMLHQKGIISSPEYWLANAIVGKQISGEHAAGLIINTAKSF